eukprot:1003164_1
MMEHYITYTITIISLLMTAATIFMAIHLIRYFLQTRTTGTTGSKPKRKQLKLMKSNSPSNKATNQRTNTISTREQHKQQIAKFFKISASISVVFNAFNAFFNSLYCIYFLWDPQHDDDMFYTQHPSHIQRITSTFSWYIAKVALVWFFSGRLYFAFKNSALHVSKRLIIWVNVINTIAAPLSLIIAYWSVYTQQLVIAEFAFNTWRIFYQIIVFTILYMFSRRLMLLNVLHSSVAMKRTKRKRENSNSKSGNASDTQQNIENGHYVQAHRGSSTAHQTKTYAKFMQLVTRNAVVVLTISVTVFLVTFCFAGFRWLFGPQTRITLLIPMNMAAFDSCITSFCLLCLFQIGDKLYDKSCGRWCDGCCSQLCSYFSVRLIHTKTTSSKDKASDSKTPITMNMQKADLTVTKTTTPSVFSNTITSTPACSKTSTVPELQMTVSVE